MKLVQGISFRRLDIYACTDPLLSELSEDYLAGTVYIEHKLN